MIQFKIVMRTLVTNEYYVYAEIKILDSFFLYLFMYKNVCLYLCILYLCLKNITRCFEKRKKNAYLTLDLRGNTQRRKVYKGQTNMRKRRDNMKGWRQ